MVVSVEYIVVLQSLKVVLQGCLPVSASGFGFVTEKVISVVVYVCAHTRRRRGLVFFLHAKYSVAVVVVSCYFFSEEGGVGGWFWLVLSHVLP